jgi:hypothetical protein
MSQPLPKKTPDEAVLSAMLKHLKECGPELAKEMEESRRVLGTIKPEEWQLRFTI